MIRVVLAAALWIALAFAATAQGREIEGVIGAQIEAMRADDFATAFDYASPNIQSRFGSADNFAAMVRGGYPMVWKPSGLRYLELREIAGALWQKVQVTDAEGRVHLLDYQMVNTGNGWKINAVQLLPAPVPSV